MRGIQEYNSDEPPKTADEAARALRISRRELSKTLDRIGEPEATYERHGRKLLFYPEHIRAIRFARANGWKVEKRNPRKARRPRSLGKRVLGKTLEQVVEETKQAGVQTTKGRKK